MTAPDNMPALAVHRLITAVWIFTALVAINVGLSIFSEFRRPHATASADPIIGRWLWIKPTEHQHEILANGTLICGGTVHGSWRPLDPNKRTYELFWRDRWTDTLTLSPDDNTLVGTNNEGEVIEAKRATFSAPDASKNSISAPPKPPIPAGETPQEAISKASVIIVVEHQKDGGRYKAVISEILKKTPGAKFNYKVGDEYAPASFVPEENVIYGKSAIVFLDRTSGDYTAKTTILEGIPAYDNMSLEVFRRLVTIASERSTNGSTSKTKGP